jgi:hypothetical protein
MNFNSLLTSPPPTCGWLVDHDVIAVFRRDRAGHLHGAAASLPPGTFAVGPVGLLSVEPEALSAAITALLEGMKGARRAALVVPTAWVRSHFLDFEILPRRVAEIEEVVRWRLKKLLPVKPSDLRVALERHHHENGQRILSMAVLERAVGGLEASFQACGVRLGLITTRLFALSCDSKHEPGATLTVQHENGFLSALLTSGGRPLLIRTKPLLPSSDSWEMMAGDLSLALDYVRTKLDIEGTLAVRCSAVSSEVEGSIRAWLSEHEDVRVLEDGRPPCSPPGLLEGLGAGRVAPVYRVLGGSRT